MSGQFESHTSLCHPLLLWPHGGRTQPLTAIINPSFPPSLLHGSTTLKNRLKTFCGLATLGTPEQKCIRDWAECADPNITGPFNTKSCFSKIMSKLGNDQMGILKINIWWLFSHKTIPKCKLQKCCIPLRYVLRHTYCIQQPRVIYNHFPKHSKYYN